MSGKRALHVEPEPRMRTFDDFCAERTITDDERTALVWHLAAFRARKTVERLLEPAPPFDISGVLREPVTKGPRGEERGG